MPWNKQFEFVNLVTWCSLYFHRYLFRCCVVLSLSKFDMFTLSLLYISIVFMHWNISVFSWILYTAWKFHIQSAMNRDFLEGLRDHHTQQDTQIKIDFKTLSKSDRSANLFADHFFFNSLFFLFSFSFCCCSLNFLAQSHLMNESWSHTHSIKRWNIEKVGNTHSTRQNSSMSIYWVECK